MRYVLKPVKKNTQDQFFLFALEVIILMEFVGVAKNR